MAKTLRKGRLRVSGLPLLLIQDGEGLYSVEVDGVQWFQTAAIHHAIVLFEMMEEHLEEYFHYEVLGNAKR